MLKCKANIKLLKKICKETKIKYIPVKSTLPCIISKCARQLQLHNLPDMKLELFTLAPTHIPRKVQQNANPRDFTKPRKLLSQASNPVHVADLCNVHNALLFVRQNLSAMA